MASEYNKIQSIWIQISIASLCLKIISVLTKHSLNLIYKRDLQIWWYSSFELALLNSLDFTYPKYSRM